MAAGPSRAQGGDVRPAGTAGLTRTRTAAGTQVGAGRPRADQSSGPADVSTARTVLRSRAAAHPLIARGSLQATSGRAARASAQLVSRPGAARRSSTKVITEARRRASPAQAWTSSDAGPLGDTAAHPLIVSGPDGACPSVPPRPGRSTRVPDGGGRTSWRPPGTRQALIVGCSTGPLLSRRPPTGSRRPSHSQDVRRSRQRPRRVRPGTRTPACDRPPRPDVQAGLRATRGGLPHHAARRATHDDAAPAGEPGPRRVGAVPANQVSAPRRWRPR